MLILEMTAPDISCGHCKATIESNLGPEAGVESVTVDTEARVVHVVYDPTRTGPEILHQKLAEIGYPASK